MNKTNKLFFALSILLPFGIASADIEVDTGWNLLGTSQEMSSSSLPDGYSVIWTFSDGQWDQDPTTIAANKGFWVKYESVNDDTTSDIQTKTITVNASDGMFTKINLITGEATTSDDWHFGYQKYLGFKVNGGTSGDGDVLSCVAKEYSTLYDEQGVPLEEEFISLNASSTEADFEAVTKDSCTPIEDSIDTYIEMEDWLSATYGQAGPEFSAKDDESNGWILRSSTKDVFAKIKVKTVEVTLGEDASRKMILSVEKYNGASFDTAVDSPILDFTEQRAYWDLETNTVVTQDDNWDLSIEKSGDTYNLQVNGGASGDGSGGIGIVNTGYTVATVSDPTDPDQVYTYFGDSAQGGMSGPGDYGAFQFDSASRKMWETFSIYLIKNGDSHYKVQILDNYGSNGAHTSGNLYIRYKSL